MMKGKRSLRRVYLLAILILIFPLLMFGCSREVSWINVEPKSVELKKVGETFQVKVAALDKENKPVPDAKLTWESSRPAVAVVDANGLITAKGSGNTVISVISENGEKAVVQCKVAVTAAIIINPEELDLQVGEKFDLEPKVVDEKGAPAENQIVAWASSNHSVAVIDDFGQVTALAPGEATITATQIDIYAKVKVTVKPAENGE
jgi:uncharacterized protein YjdB